MYCQDTYTMYLSVCLCEGDIYIYEQYIYLAIYMNWFAANAVVAAVVAAVAAASAGTSVDNNGVVRDNGLRQKKK